MQKRAEIRHATTEDLPTILAMVKELAAFEKEPEAVTAVVSDYQDAFESGLIKIHIAEIEKEIVGMVLYYLTFSTWKGKMLYLEDFYVKPAYRSSGVGQQLFDTYLSEAKKENCKVAKWQVLDWNQRAIDFYKRQNAVIETEWLNGKLLL